MGERGRGGEGHFLWGSFDGLATVIASEATQSMPVRWRDGLLRFARNDDKALNLFVWHHLRRSCLTLRRGMGRGLSSGTGWERIAPESLTHSKTGFVHRNISRWCTRRGTRSSLRRLHKRRFGSEILKVWATAESNQKRERVKQGVGSNYHFPLWERVARTRESAFVTGEGSVSADRDPSSGASRHLLPQGEKGRGTGISSLRLRHPRRRG